MSKQDTSGIEIHVGPDGLEEYDNPMPRWWLYLFYFTIVYAVVYCMAYPSFWFWNGFTGWTQEGQYAQNAPKPKPGVEEMDLSVFAKDTAALEAGKANFAKYCAACHGNNLEGKVGPCLTDAEWKYGGTDKDILISISKGRPAGMPTWGKVLKPDEIAKTAAFVKSMKKP